MYLSSFGRRIVCNFQIVSDASLPVHALISERDDLHVIPPMRLLQRVYLLLVMV
jgi:hypothetical protein